MLEDKTIDQSKTYVLELIKTDKNGVEIPFDVVSRLRQTVNTRNGQNEHPAAAPAATPTPRLTSSLIYLREWFEPPS